MKEEQVLNALSSLTNGALNYYQAPQTVLVREKFVRDYIEDLQLNVQKLNDQLDRELIKRARLEDRIKKAIEFIKDRAFDLELPTIQEELLEILKGEE